MSEYVCAVQSKTTKMGMFYSPSSFPLYSLSQRLLHENPDTQTQTYTGDKSFSLL